MPLEIAAFVNLLIIAIVLLALLLGLEAVYVNLIRPTARLLRRRAARRGLYFTREK